MSGQLFWLLLLLLFVLLLFATKFVRIVAGVTHYRAASLSARLIKNKHDCFNEVFGSSQVI